MQHRFQHCAALHNARGVSRLAIPPGHLPAAKVRAFIDFVSEIVA